MTNYRTWIMTLAYAFSFGIELAMDNILGQYFVDYFNLPIGEAGHRAASFGIMAVGVRGFGGFISDTLAKRFGIRGRIVSAAPSPFSPLLFCLASLLSLPLFLSAVMNLNQSITLPAPPSFPPAVEPVPLPVLRRHVRHDHVPPL